MGLVEGIPGPTGGYKPTAEAFDAIDRQQMDEAESVVVAHDYDRVDVTVEEITLHERSRPGEVPRPVALRVRADFSEGRRILGPTPIDARRRRDVVAVDESNSEILLDVAKIEGPVEEPDTYTVPCDHAACCSAFGIDAVDHTSASLSRLRWDGSGESQTRRP